MADQDFQIRVVTTADTSGIQKTSAALDALQTKAEQEAAKVAAAQAKAVEAAAAEVGRALRIVAGGAVIAGGYKFVSELREAATQIEKISAELDKQGGELVKHAQAYAEAAKFATTEADVIKLGESALKNVEAAHKRLLDTAGKELTTFDKIKDIWVAGFRDKGPLAQMLELEKAEVAQNYQLERQQAILAITNAQRDKQALAAKDYAGQVEYLTRKIEESEAAQQRFGIKNIEDYLKAGAEAEKYRNILENIIRTEKRRADEADRAAREADKAAEKKLRGEESFFKGAVESASPQVQRTLQQEEAFRRTGDDQYLKSAEAFKRGMTQSQREEYEGLTKGGNQQAVIDAIQQLRQDLIGIWR